MPNLFKGVKILVPNVVLKSSKGVRLEAECGRKFLDLSSGIGVTNLGHSHSGVNKAIQSAVENLVHAQQNAIIHRPMIDLIDRLSALSFSKKAGFDSWFFWNSGTEAIEASLKLVRQITGRPNVICMNLGYHGRTYAAMAMTNSGAAYRSGFGPLPSGFPVTPFPYVSRGPYGYRPADQREWLQAPRDSSSIDGYRYWGLAPPEIAQKEVERCLDQLELLLRTQSSPSDTAALILEPVLGEGGYVAPPPGYMKGLREICDRHSILLIADEVQSGFGRSGSMFACEWIDGGVNPDVIVCAKGLANGFPISAVGTRTDLSIKQPVGGMGGTYGGNAVGCAAALAVLEAFEKEGVIENVLARERDARRGLLPLQKLMGRDGTTPVLREIRGRGLMLGLEFNHPLANSLSAGPKPAPGSFASLIVQHCVAQNMLILQCGPYDTIRICPALNISQRDLEEGLEIFVNSVHKATEEVLAKSS